MAGPNRVEVEIVAKDEATPTITKLEKRIDGLEADEARIVVKLEAEKLDKQWTTALAKLKGLTGDELTVQMRVVADIENASVQIKQLQGQLEDTTGTVHVAKVDVDTTQAVTNVEKLGKSADSSKSVLANMVGNATQDLGALGGVAGSAGVAIGQMGEYMADARAEGEGFGSILSNFGAVAGPIAAISVGIGLATKAWTDYKAKQKAIQEAIKTTTEGLAETLDIVNDFPTKFDKAGTAYEAFADILLGNEGDRDKVVGFLSDLNLTLSDLPGLISDITTQDPAAIGELIRQLGGSDEAAEAVAKLVDEGTNLSKINSNADLLAWVDKFDQKSTDAILTVSGLADEINGLQPNEAAAHFLDRIATSSPEARDAIAQLRKEMPGATDVEILDAYVRALDRQTEALKRQKPLLQQIVDLNNTLIDKVKERVTAIQEQFAADRDAAEAAKQTISDIQQLSRDMILFKGDVGSANTELEDLVGNLDDIEAGALKDALDTGNGPLDTLTNLQDINQEIRDFADFINDPKGLAGAIPNIFDPADVNADDFLDKIAQLKGPIQDQVEQTFGESGAAAAEAMADSLVETIAKQTGLTPDVVSTLLGLDDLKAKINLSIEVSEVDKAKAQLDILQSLLDKFPGATFEDQVWIVNMRMALDAGEITGQHAQELIQPKLRGFGVTIPTELDVPDTDKTRREAQAEFDRGEPIRVPAKLDLTDAQAEFLFARGQLPVVRPGTSTPVTINHTTINPAGTPPETVGSVRVYYNRNGDRTET